MARRSEYRGTDRSRAPRGRKVTVKEENTLLPFLFGLLNEQSKSSVKALLAHGQISVNGTVTSQFNTPLTPGNEVLISYERGKVEFNNPLLTIVWEDDDLIVVNKKEGLLSVSSTRVKERTALHLLSEYVKKTDPRNKIFVLHRLDRDTSGLMMFAKNLQVQKALQSNWNSAITARTYVAVVEGRPEKDSDLIVSNLTENASVCDSRRRRERGDHPLPPAAQQRSLLAVGTRPGDRTQEPDTRTDAINRTLHRRRLQVWCGDRSYRTADASRPTAQLHSSGNRRRDAFRNTHS